MTQRRWFSILGLAVGLFAINAVTRLVIHFGFKGDDSVEGKASIVMFALIGVVLAVWCFLVCQRRRPSEWVVPDWFVGAVGGMLLTVLVGPFISGGNPFDSGAGDFFLQVWLYLGFAIVGSLLGYWIAMVLGRDYRSRALKAYTAARSTKPRKVVRR
jgi:phosphotransferase system  glucose/maltose/N-acetylglucosamine-specific IIC component